MPLKRTPPTTPKTAKTTKNCTSDMTTNISNTDTTGTASRTRSRKQTPDSVDFMSEIRNIIADFKHEQNCKLDALQTTISDIKKQNIGIIQSIEHLSEDYNNLKKQLELIEKEKRDNLQYIYTLETRIEHLENAQRISSIEIRNIPPRKGETKDDLAKLMNTVGRAINLTIQNSDIKDVFRINTKTEGNKPIILDFNSVLLKEKFLEHTKYFNNQHKDNKLNTSHLHIHGSSKPIFIAENLTSKGKRLFFLARDFAKTYNFAYCWAAYGKIFIRKNEGDNRIRISSEADLDKLKSECEL